MSRRVADFAAVRELAPFVTEIIAATSARLGTYDKARVDGNRRFSATLAIALQRADDLDLLLVGDGFGIGSWEAAFRAVEAEDPAKIDRYPSVKGTLGAVKADDRTYLGVAF